MRHLLSGYISYGDIVDFYHMVRLRGVKFVFGNLRIRGSRRSTSKWDNFERSATDFWIIPELQRHWNAKCTGNPFMEYEEYVSKTYFNNKSDLRLLSVGCGNSSHELAFARSGCFSLVEGIDISEKQLAMAKQQAADREYKNVQYWCGDFKTEIIPVDSYDVVLFNSSLHHFSNVEKIVSDKIRPILKENGLLVIFEYTGPNRLQWTDEQLENVNTLLKTIPVSKKRIYNSKAIKKKVYRPGIVRMFLSDPSEAPDSESILEAVHNHFEVLEEIPLGGNLLHPLLKGIAHHFTDSSRETIELFNYLISEDEAFVVNNNSDFTFGIYRKALIVQKNR